MSTGIRRSTRLVCSPGAGFGHKSLVGVYPILVFQPPLWSTLLVLLGKILARARFLEARRPLGPEYGLLRLVIQARKWPKNIKSGTNRDALPPFGPKLCEVRATGPRMPADPKTAQKSKNPAKYLGFGVLGPWAPPVASLP